MTDLAALADALRAALSRIEALEAKQPVLLEILQNAEQVRIELRPTAQQTH